MAISKVIQVLVIVFIVALGSGIVIGKKFPMATKPDSHERSRLSDELKLNDDQREKMRNIWQEVVRGGSRQGGFDRRRQLAKERDEAIAAIMTKEQKPAYDAVLATYSQQVAELSKEREATFQKAVEQTKAILDPGQRAKYEELLAKGTFGPGRRPGTGPSTQATRPALEK